MLIAMAGIGCGWLLSIAALAGLGAGALRIALGEKQPGFFVSFWTGFAAWIGFLQLAHFFVPLERSPLLGLGLLGGVAGCIGYGRAWVAALRRFVRAHPVASAVAAGFALWLCNRALGPLLTVDAGLYHLGSIRWAAEHPLVGGLANLHGRLAFNSSIFLWMASLDGLASPIRGFHLASSSLVLVGFLHRVERSVEHPDERRRHSERGLVLPLVYAATVMHVSSTSPDWAILVLGITAGSLGLDAIDPTEDAPASRTRTARFALASVIGVAVTIKLSFGVAALALAAVHIVWAWTPRARIRAGTREVVATALFIGLLALPWLARGIELSGYPAYPLTVFAPGVEWQIPAERARAEADWIRSWARAPGRAPEQVLADSAWFEPWLAARFKQSDSIALLIFPLAFLAISIALRKRGLAWDARSLSVAPFALATLAWFATAPDPRFLGAALWLPTMWFASGTAISNLLPGVERGLRFASLALFVGYCGWMAAELDALFIRSSGPIPVRMVETRVFTTRSGLELRVPLKGDQCWEAPLPCTPYPAPRLGLRDASDLWGGYRLLPNSAPPSTRE